MHGDWAEAYSTLLVRSLLKNHLHFFTAQCIFTPSHIVCHTLYKDVVYAKHSSHFHQSLCCTIVLQQSTLSGKCPFSTVNNYVSSYMAIGFQLTCCLIKPDYMLKYIKWIIYMSNHTWPWLFLKMVRWLNVFTDSYLRIKDPTWETGW